MGRPEKVTVAELLDDYLTHKEIRGLRSLRTLKVHLKPVSEFFGGWRAMEVASASIEAYQRDRLDDGKAPATVNRELV